MRQNGRIVPVAAIIAVGVNSDGRRKVPGLDIGACGACGGAAVYGTPACSALPFRTGSGASSPAGGCAGSSR
ncbi:MAG: hypothetical protein IOD01_03320 [Rhodobacter sp.]|nr:hypothetical protein [Rhodobacter sp.]